MAFSVAISVVKDEFAAEEVVQEAFIKAFNGLRAFKGRSKFSTWFYRIVVNEALEHLRKSKRELISFNAEYMSDVADDSILESLQEEEQIYLINEALKKLAPKESLVLRLFYLEEENIKTVCDITGWSKANTKVMLHRARKSMLIVLNRLMKAEI